ncbi:MAG: tRNA (5-methylaminomethyl-2-thiouridine)(34)-methyltransferase MnmD [Myxococcota bacterium]|nr:tRNA (5-methylaminomethyl-2-thiouridine)(34)-methyltransferase MnmD [Myxococcota bacterium]
MTERLPSATEARTEKTADGSLTLGWDASSVTYRSRYGAWTEANHVFVEGAAALSHTQPHIFEFGLGAATNLFATLAALLDSPATTHLIYETLEAAPLSERTFAEVVSSYPMNESVKRQGLKLLLDAITTGTRQHLQLTPNQSVELAVHHRSGLPELKPEILTAVYFDPFGPKDNPDAWTPEIFQEVAKAMLPTARLATYAAASEPRRNMRSAGLIVARCPGAGGKREMTVAAKTESPLQDMVIWPKKLK